ncbi:SET domain-containing protein [Muriicola sp.]|uniref:SET domain-containing protein n=1 Tax=Muriicola sp. TaxID=2020856 RepID=UPI0035674F39
MIHPDTELRFINKAIGYGVVATRDIPAGTITWVLDALDREFTPSQYDQMPPIYKKLLDTYTYRNNKGHYILCWDLGRYVNHSFRSNCLSTAYEFEIAIRDIKKGEQLTDDYGYLNLQEPFRGMDEGTERKVVYPDDLLYYHQIWDADIRKVFGLITSRKQPLRPLVNEPTWKTVLEIIDGKKEMDSILLNYYRGS